MRRSAGLGATRGILYGAALLLWLGSGCKGCSCRDRTPEGELASPAASEVEVVDEGSLPRVDLRVRRESGFRYRIHIETSSAAAIAGQPLPPAPVVTVVLDHEVTRGSAEPIVEQRDGGAIRMIEERVVISYLGIRHDLTPPDVVASWNAALLRLVGSSVVQRVSEAATVPLQRTELLGGAEPPEAVARALDVSLDAQRHFPFRLPSIPVGVGAKWRFSEPIAVHGAKGTQTAELSVKALDGRTAVLTLTVSQEAPRQEVPHPFLPGQKAVLEEFHGKSQGEITVDRATALPLRSGLLGTTDLVLSADDQGKRVTLPLHGASFLASLSSLLDDPDATPSAAPVDP